VGGYFDCRSIAVLDNLVTALVGQSNSQKGGYCDENLKYRWVKDIFFLNLSSYTHSIIMSMYVI